MSKTHAEIKKEIKKVYKQLSTWDKVAQYYSEQKGVRFTKALLWKIVEKDIHPHEEPWRSALGYPALIPTAACPDCGIVHTLKRCPKKRKPMKGWKTWYDYPNWQLVDLINNRHGEQLC
jgi:hypothetical protein